MPETKDVRIVLREGFNIVTLVERVLWECPTCGGPMGEPKNHNFYENDDSYHCDTWNNPCGHIATYRELKLLRGSYFISYKEAKEQGMSLNDFLSISV